MDSIVSSVSGVRASIGALQRLRTSYKFAPMTIDDEVKRFLANQTRDLKDFEVVYLLLQSISVFPFEPIAMALF